MNNEENLDIIDFSLNNEVEVVSDSIDEKLKELNNSETITNNNLTLNFFQTDIEQANNVANSKVDENPEFANLMEKVTDKFNENLGTNVSHEDLESYLLNRASKSEKEKQEENIVREGIAQEAIGYLENKYLLVLVKYLDGQMNQMLRSDILNSVSEESMALMDRLLLMRKELEKLSSRFKGSGDTKSKLKNLRGEEQNNFDEETMKIINLLKESSLNKYNSNTKSNVF